MADQETKFSEEELKSLQDLQNSYQGNNYNLDN